MSEGNPEPSTMTEWDAQTYRKISTLQEWLANKSLQNLALTGDEQVLDVGCGDGRITAKLAGRVPRGTVIGTDASQAMIAFAARTFPRATHANLTFRVADAARLPFDAEFDLIVSFNCLHWVSDQAGALRGIRRALRPAGRAVVRFVPAGERRSLEDVIEETCTSPTWAAYFPAHRPPYVHPTADAYRRLATDCGLAVERLEVCQESWDFGSRAAFARFADATFVEWTRCVPPEHRAALIADVLERYATRAGADPAAANVFTFYQLEAECRPA